MPLPTSPPEFTPVKRLRYGRWDVDLVAFSITHQPTGYAFPLDYARSASKVLRLIAVVNAAEWSSETDIVNFLWLLDELVGLDVVQQDGLSRFIRAIRKHIRRRAAKVRQLRGIPGLWVVRS